MTTTFEMVRDKVVSLRGLVNDSIALVTPDDVQVVASLTGRDLFIKYALTDYSVGNTSVAATIPLFVEAYIDTDVEWTKTDHAVAETLLACAFIFGLEAAADSLGFGIQNQFEKYGSHDYSHSLYNLLARASILMPFDAVSATFRRATEAASEDELRQTFEQECARGVFA